MASEFEHYLDETLGPASDQLDRRAKRVSTLARRLAAAVASGDMKSAETLLRDIDALPLGENVAECRAASGAYDYRNYLANGFATDFEAACRDAGLDLEGIFPNYSVFPFPVRVDVEGMSVVINRRRVGTLRPSVLVDAIRDERDRLERSPFNPTEFVGVLYNSWDRLSAQQAVASGVNARMPQMLKQVYRDLVPFGRWRREYPESFFAYDVQRLLLSHVIQHGNFQCVLEKGRGSAGALRMIDREGQERLIATVNFVKVAE